VDRKLDLLALTETWVTSNAPDAVKFDVAQPGYQIIDQHSGTSTEKRGGGVAFVHADSIGIRPLDVGNTLSFEILAVRLTTRPTVHTTVACIYRPTGVMSRQFCDELAELLDQLVTAKQQFVICNLIVSDRLKSLGVTTDSHLRFDCHANNAARACNYHTRALRHVRSLLTDDVAQTVTRSIVAS